jgi:NADH:ubiquinone oxidoreductase subunit H
MDPQLIANLLVVLILSVIAATGLMLGFAAMTVVERKTLARFTLRYGPNRVGKFGSLQVIADMFKMFFKEEVIPKSCGPGSLSDGPWSGVGAGPDGFCRCIPSHFHALYPAI